MSMDASAVGAADSACNTRMHDTGSASARCRSRRAGREAVQASFAERDTFDIRHGKAIGRPSGLVSDTCSASMNR
ncbi:hypothetical protein DDQ41_06975 [Streptomyces spongiicola]|uniref:Uncharacterized protein n=1 Tax=Streptomyces spongiicola TaxID=1690221 RepID=A0ABM6V4B8_9ACTN|nr:hypothetical protein DDQ41_06975 [Streptomyces spongiicola]